MHMKYHKPWSIYINIKYCDLISSEICITFRRVGRGRVVFWLCRGNAAIHHVLLEQFVTRCSTLGRGQPEHNLPSLSLNHSHHSWTRPSCPTNNNDHGCLVFQENLIFPPQRLNWPPSNGKLAKFSLKMLIISHPHFRFRKNLHPCYHHQHL